MSKRGTYVYERDRFEAAQTFGLWLSTRGPRIVRRFGMWVTDVAHDELLRLKVRSWGR